MTIVSGHRRARITTLALVVALVGGTVGIEAAASHLSSMAVHSDRAAPAGTAQGDGVMAGPDLSFVDQGQGRSAEWALHSRPQPVAE